MRVRVYGKAIGIGVLVVLSLAFSNAIFAQGGTGTLRGQILDPSGAAVANTSVVVTSDSGKVSVATTNSQGAYEVTGLAPGAYKVEALAKGFAPFAKTGVQVAASQIAQVNAKLEIQQQEQKVVVSSEAPTVDVSPENNAGAIVISGTELDALSDDPDEMESELQALAGPSAGPNGGQMYIDGFTAGELPPKSSIREIRINSNPFSSEYDRVGYGRIEILTKPGTDNFHGQFMVMGNDSAFNSSAPFGPPDQPSYHSVMYNGSVGGPLSKKASFFFSAQRRNTNDLGIINAPAVLDANGNIVDNFRDVVPNNHVRTNLGPRFDYQLGKNDTLTARYQFWRNSSLNQNVGGLTLASLGGDQSSTEHTLQLSESHTFGASTVMDSRFQYIHENSTTTPLTIGPSISVTGGFEGGGSAGTSLSTENRYEFQSSTQMALHSHVLTFGARIRQDGERSISPSGYNGSFAFSSIQAYQIAEQNIGNPLAIPAEDLPYQFSITAPLQGIAPPPISASVLDAGLFLQDDWRVRPNITLSSGLRFETQNEINDHADWAPRLAIAWGLGNKNSPKTVLRAGWGIFYDRFSEGNVMTLRSLNGTIQNSYLLNTSAVAYCFPDPTAAACQQQLTSGLEPSTTVYRFNPNFRAPYDMQTAISVDQQITKVGRLSITYMNSRGVHQMYTTNVNAPLPGTFTPGDTTTYTDRPNPNFENIDEFESEGIYRENQFIVSGSMRAGSRMTFNANYTLRYADGNTSGGFPTNPYDLDADYGPTGMSIRHRFFILGSFSAPYGIRLSPIMTVSSGRPYSVNFPRDMIGSGSSNQRPGFISPATCAAVTTTGNSYCTPLGTFDISPATALNEMPINSFVGPGSFSLNMRVSKTFGFGKPTENARGGRGGGRGGFGGGGGRGGRGGGNPFGGGFGGFGGGGGVNHPYNLTFTVSASNLLNNVNLGNPVATIGSNEFGQTISTGGGGFGGGRGGGGAANRTIQLQASFSF
ncbi:MAG TPA: carboxypeptidase regulatory-like domain-containing protein [Candidatus Acidoferrales bacterium]|nr:carboxypeptidase regulatory-like domain-containing protein [Candidatus Acidoferrales bacterium]